MYRLLVWINNALNRYQYNMRFSAWANLKKMADEHNRRVQSDPTFRYDAFGHEKLRDPGPPPDAAKIMNQSLSDNWVLLVFYGAVVVFFLGACLFIGVFKR